MLAKRRKMTFKLQVGVVHAATQMITNNDEYS